MLGIRATPRRPTPSTGEGVIASPVAGEDATPAESRDLRNEVLERRLAAERHAKSGAGLPRPEASDRKDLVESRRCRITDAMLLKHGFFENCRGCERRPLGEEK